MPYTSKPISSNIAMPFYPPAPTSESSFHKANCHCGAVRFTVKLSPPLNEYPTSSCNCSICTKNGYLLVYPPITDVTFERGQDGLKSYRFATRQAEHQFCGECGSSCFLTLPEEPESEFVAVNVCFSCYCYLASC